MPELPEVETIARQLRRHGIEGCTVRSVAVNWARTVDPFSVEEFSEALTGTTIDKISRVGKWLLFALGSGQTLMVHLRMSGSFSMTPGTHDRIILELSGGILLYFSDPRKFGRWKLVGNPNEILESLGPDALSRHFSLNGFCHEMKRRHRMIKPLLLDQTVVAGLGNIYVDEALWEAQIHPECLSDSLSADKLEQLFKAIKHVLKVGVRNRGTSLGEGKANYRDVDGESGDHREVVKAYGRTGCPCERCGSSLKKITVAQRGTHFCPACQQK